MKDLESFLVSFYKLVENNAEISKIKICIQNGIDQMAALFGLTPLQFAENLEWKRHEVAQHDEEPLVVAEKYICPYKFLFHTI